MHELKLKLLQGEAWKEDWARVLQICDAEGNPRFQIMMDINGDLRVSGVDRALLLKLGSDPTTACLTRSGET